MNVFLFIALAVAGFWFWRRIFQFIASRIWLNAGVVHMHLDALATVTAAARAEAQSQGVNIPQWTEGEVVLAVLDDLCAKLGRKSALITGLGILSGLGGVAWATRYYHEPLWAFIVAAVLALLGRFLGAALENESLHAYVRDDNKPAELRATALGLRRANGANVAMDLMILVVSGLAGGLWVGKF